ncbi:MAG: Concanavalin A-like lectin/glucanase superfamily protein [Mucilaginibacter sp.]|nr:Concanavalin A-like lectin/glucanase superfamily protein [Mucilaginibacter sp.]
MRIGVSTLMLGALSSCQKKDGVKLDTPQNAQTVKRSLSVNGIVGSNLSSGLIAYWSMDNTAYDLSGNGHNGTVNNVTVTADRFGNPRGAFHFDGSTSYISVPDQAALRLGNTDFTLNAWVKADAYNSGLAILTKRFSGINNGYVWTITGGSPNGVVSYGPGGGNTNAFGTTVIGLNTWAMVTSIYNLASQQLSIYVNGVLDRTVGGISPANASVTAALYIGRDNPNVASSGYFFQGSLDEIRLYNRAINGTELQQLYNATAPPTPSSGLVAYLPLTSTGNDLSGQGHNGTLNNITSSTTDRLGNPIGAYQFNGTNSYISVASTLIASRSFNVWVRADSYNGSFGSVILGNRGTGGTSNFSISVVGNAGPGAGKISFGNGGINNVAYSNSAISLGGWHMITCTYNPSGGQALIYIDGVLDSTTNGITSITFNDLFYIGRDSPAAGGNGYFFNGSINALRIYTYQLSATEIQNLYNALN